MIKRIFLVALFPFANGSWAATIIPDFDAAVFTVDVLVNRYFPLSGSDTVVIGAEGVDEDGEAFTERSELTVLGPGPTIMGVETTTQLDRAYEDGLLVEETFDYFAADSLGNVWYFGEDVTNFIYDDDDNLIETNNESAWQAGMDGARPGWIMPADPFVGLSYFQEVAEAADALDQAMIWALDATVEIEGLGGFEDVLVTLEKSDLDPDAREFKYYAQGLGLIRVEEGLSPELGDPKLVFNRRPSEVPLPAGLPLLLAALGALGAMARRRR